MKIFQSIIILVFVCVSTSYVNAMEDPAMLCEAPLAPLVSLDTGVFYQKSERHEKMEDRFTISKIAHYFHENQQLETDRFFGVYDGHGSFEVADYLQKKLHKTVAEQRTKERDVTKVENAIKYAFAASDQHSKTLRGQGSTAVTGLLLGNQLWIAHAGDSRAVIFQIAHGERYYLSTIDHKPDHPNEKARIEAAKGFIQHNGVWRAGGYLAVSKSIGDYPKEGDSKIKGLNADPNIHLITLNPTFEFMILATDGIWDVMTGVEAANFVKSAFALGSSAQNVAKHLVNKALQAGSKDDLTAMVVRFKW